MRSTAGSKVDPTFEVAAVSGFLLVLTPEFAGAQTRDPAAAEVLFRRSHEAMEAQRCAEALPSSSRANGSIPLRATDEQRHLRRKSGTSCQRLAALEEAIDPLAPTDNRVAFARNRVQALERKLPRLAVTLTSGRDRGAGGVRDGVELGPASQGVPLQVDTGNHAITVRMPGHRLEQTGVRVGEGEQKRIEVQPGAVEEQAVKIGNAKQLGAERWARR